jgi:hypothetical protein
VGDIPESCLPFNHYSSGLITQLVSAFITPMIKAAGVLPALRLSLNHSPDFHLAGECCLLAVRG